jgi:dTDP-4-amino-4,6-dideoxygalactose transaminase
MKHIPFLKPNLPKKDAYLAYLSQIDESRLYSNYGPLNSLFESRLLSECFENQGAVTTVNNATTGLMLAISQTMRQKSKYALMPSFTFAATPLAAMWCGLEPYFIDIRKDDLCMDEEILDETLTKLGDEVAVVIPYATFGTYLDLTHFCSLQNSGVPVVVDAAPGFGTIGNDGQFGKQFPGTVVFSFHATKPFGIGEGGMVYAGNPETISMIRQAGNFGFSEKKEAMTQGLNAKMSEYAAAIALATLDDFPRKIQARQDVYHLYIRYFEDTGLFDKGYRFHKTEGKISFQFVSVLCPKRQSNVDLVNHLSKNLIESRTYFCPACHQQPHFVHLPHSPLPNTEDVSQCILSLPLWEEMEARDVYRVVDSLNMEGH